MPLQIDYSVARKWKNGFEGTISVTNAGLTPVTEWQVTFDFFDVTLLSVSDAAIIAETERIYTIAPLAGGPALLPGGTASVGFTARGNAARLPLFVGDDEEEEDFDDDGLWTDPAADVVPFPGRTAARAVPPVPANWDSASAADGLMPTDGLLLDDGQVRDLLARVDWLYFEGGAMTRVQSVLGMGDRMPLPRPANENSDPLFAGSSSSSSNGSTSVPATTPAVSGACGTATDTARAAAKAGKRSVQEPASSRTRTTTTTTSSSSATGEPGAPAPFPPLPPRDDWLL